MRSSHKGTWRMHLSCTHASKFAPKGQLRLQLAPFLRTSRRRDWVLVECAKSWICCFTPLQENISAHCLPLSTLLNAPKEPKVRLVRSFSILRIQPHLRAYFCPVWWRIQWKAVRGWGSLFLKCTISCFSETRTPASRAPLQQKLMSLF